MITFKKGEFIGGDLLEIIHFDFIEDDMQDWWDNRLKEDCVVLVIPSGDENMEMFYPVGNGLLYIPREDDTDNEHHDKFWKSHTTMVFDSKSQALEFMKSYKGFEEERVREFAEDIEEEEIQEEAYHNFCCTCSISDDMDEEFLEELTLLLESKRIGLDSIYATLKYLMLDYYRIEIMQDKLNPDMG